MAALAFFFAVYQTVTTPGLTTSSLWASKFFEYLLADNVWIQNAWVWIWIALVVLSIVILALVGYFLGKEALLGCGCIVFGLGIFVLLFPLVQYFIVLICQVMANSVTPNGVTDWPALVICGIAYLLLCLD